MPWFTFLRRYWPMGHSSSVSRNILHSLDTMYCKIFVTKEFSKLLSKGGQWCNHKHGHSGSVHVPHSQPSPRHSALLTAEVSHYYLVRGSCSGYWYMGIFILLFRYCSSQRSGLLKALSLSQSKLLRRRLAWLQHCLIKLTKKRHNHAIFNMV